MPAPTSSTPPAWLGALLARGESLEKVLRRYRCATGGEMPEEMTEDDLEHRVDPMPAPDFSP